MCLLTSARRNPETNIRLAIYTDGKKSKRMGEWEIGSDISLSVPFLCKFDF